MDPIPGGSGQAAVNSPQLDPVTMQPAMRAIKNAGQAWEIVKGLESENRDRAKIAGRIMDRYNAERPQPQKELEAQGLGWKNNFSTKPLVFLIEKIAPRFQQAVKAMRYITSSAFPENVPGANEKTEAFRKEISKVCRTREGWNDLVSDIAQENALFGFTSVAWHDEYSWFPKHHRQDSFYVPQGTKHYASSAQIYVAKDEFLLHEFFAFIQDQEAARVAGWNVENAVAAINDAQPETAQSKFSDPQRVYADLQRELTIGSSFASGARTVNVYHVCATELSGRVTHYIIGAKDGKELFCKEDRFASMSDVCAFFSFQHGNGKLHGSKGVGRDVYNIAAALDRARNEVMDRLHMAGKMVVSAQEKNIKRFRMSVFGNAVIISDDFKVQQTRIDGDVEPFIQLDGFFTRLLDQLVGATSSNQTQRSGDRVTRAEVELEASREEERRDAVIERFLSQFVRMVSTIQRRMCDPNCNEADAVAMRQRLLKVMTPEELQWISNQPAAETVQDYSERERQAVILASAEARGNPLYNQKEIERRKVTAQVSAEFADAVLLPDNDPTEQAEQSRQQMLENGLITMGQNVPVSPRDNFLVHFTELEPVVTAAQQQTVEDPNAFLVFRAAVQHAADHLQLALQSGVDKKAIAQPMAMVQQWTQQVKQLDALNKQAMAQGIDPGTGQPLPTPSGAAPAQPATPPAPAPVNQPVTNA